MKHDLLNGHESIIIASTETYDDQGRLYYCEPVKYIGSEGSLVHRIPYKYGYSLFARKLRRYKGTTAILKEYNPDVIMFHGACAQELRVVAKLVRSNPGIRLYIDSHEDWNNSARNFLSREVLHRGIYKPALHSAIDVCTKLFCVSTESIDFMNSFYGIPQEKLELFPLGGDLIADEDYQIRRTRKRAQLRVNASTRVLVQTGKQTGRKLLVESLKAYCLHNNNDSIFVIAGTISDEIRSEVQQLAKANPRIRYEGWLDPDQLTDLLCAADVYVQPGTQSATMQHSLCCRCAVILADVPAHDFYKCENGWYIQNTTMLKDAIGEALHGDIGLMQQQSFDFAKRHLDYRILSQKYSS